MIEKFKTITRFGIFQNFDWNSSVRDQGNNISTFKKLNILYGRNYSGKTSLSRIVRSLEQKKLPEKFHDAEFEVVCSGINITQNSLGTHSFNIRVYNEDFVNENLTFLRNENEDVQSFAVLGETNVEIEKKIKEIKSELGSEEEKKGLKYSLFQKTNEKLSKTREKSNIETALDKKLRRKANDEIKTNHIYNDINYNISKIKQDIRSIKKTNSYSPLTKEECENNLKLLNERSKDDIDDLQSFSSNIDNLLEKSKELLRKEITPTKSIQDLLNDALLQEWVRSGIKYHKGKRNTCAFCGNSIPDYLWGKLDAHFSKESESLRLELEDIINKLENEKLNFDVLLPLSTDDFYSIYQDDFKEKEKRLRKEIKKYNKDVDSLIKLLNNRLKNIFTPVTAKAPSIDAAVIGDIVDNLEVLVKNHNKKTTTLNNDQCNARIALRLHEVYKFLQDIDYDAKQKQIDNLKTEVKAIQDDINGIEEEISNKEDEIKKLEIEQRDERKGAEKINEYLHHFFGNDNIRFDAIEDSESFGYKFRVLREGNIAHSLSEGERSLIAFCYFMAKLEDIDTKGKKLSIWIDDPISSLDGNHIFFIFSLIENILAKPLRNQDGSNEYKYEQLIISTHNLDFLKYLKRLSHPRSNNGGTEYFLIERVNNNAKIALMPSYLKRYVTEFNFLFHQIYKCSISDPDAIEHDVFYNFGNNLRKFLEAYLFYKYPCHTDDKLEKLRLFFGDDGKAVEVSNRMSNELSHLEEIFDRSMKPIEIPEIPKLAKYVLWKIKEKDKDQYDSLLKSIGESDS
ncbi:AAA family ATPase [Thiolapillus sp.]